MLYSEAVDWVHRLPRLAAPGLDRMRALMAALGNPQRRLSFVHVAGTNGKGSAVTMTASVLAAAGYKTGANISPYVLDFRERFLLNGEMARQEELAEVFTEVRAAAEALPQLPIEFEAVTAAALLYFAQMGCEIVCLEAGIGGRLDSTNIIENTLAAYIMRIGYDHTEILGSTLEKIAAEKCGIIKNGCTVVGYPCQPAGVADVIAAGAAIAGSALVIPQASDVLFEEPGGWTQAIHYKGLSLRVPFAGEHQAFNAAVVAEGIGALRQQGFVVSDNQIAQGIQSARFPVRIEVWQQDPLVILDGAHSGDSAMALAQVLRQKKLYNLVAVAGVLADKPAREILQPLFPHISTLYTVAPENPRALPAEALAAEARKYVDEVIPCQTVNEALLAAQKKKNTGGLLVFGSLYLASAVRLLLEIGRKND